MINSRPKGMHLFSSIFFGWWCLWLFNSNLAILYYILMLYTYKKSLLLATHVAWNKGFIWVNDCVPQTSELGSRLCIVLPALPALVSRLSQARFLECVRAYREDCSTLTPEVIQRLLQQADSVLPHHRVEAERAQLHALKGTLLFYLLLRQTLTEYKPFRFNSFS